MKKIQRYSVEEIPSGYWWYQPEEHLPWEPVQVMDNRRVYGIGSVKYCKVEDMRGIWMPLKLRVGEANSHSLLEVVKLAYRKHHLQDTTIGWEELSEALHNALCNAIGDDAFVEWNKTARAS